MDKWTMLLKSWSDILEQAGKRLSGASVTKVNAAIAVLNELLSGDVSVTEEVAEQGYAKASTLLQEMVTGISTKDSFEEWQARLRRAVTKSDIIPGRWKYPVVTWADAVVVSSEVYNSDGTMAWMHFYVPFTESGDVFLFGEPTLATIEQIVRLLGGEQNTEEDTGTAVADDVMEQSVELLGAVIEQGEGRPPYLLQEMALTTTLLQEKKNGTVVFGGTATVGNVVNSHNQVYPTELWQQQMPIMAEMMKNSRLVGATWHPRDDNGNPRDVQIQDLSHKFTKMELQGDKLVFEAETLDTAQGRDLAGVMKAGIQIHMSTRGSGDVKRGSWQGQSVDIIQPDSYVLHGIDAVLNGASPGSAVDYARLQSLDGEPNGRREQTLNPEEIKKLIEQAIASGNGELTTQLQGVLAKVEALEQASGLTDDQKAILEQAAALIEQGAAAKKIEARDAKIKEVVGKLVQEGKLTGQFTNVFTQFLTDMCQSAEEVEGKVAIVQERMAPFVESHNLMQSRGMYVPEFKDDGTKRAAPRSYGELIEELVQSQIAKGNLTDNGVDDFSNTARSMRIILNNICQEKPVLADAYLLKRNGQITSIEQSRDFLGQDRLSQLLSQDIPAGAMTTDDVAAAVPYVMPIVTEVFPQLVAMQLGTLQPMDRSTGRIYYYKTKDEDGNELQSAASFTGSYTNDPGEKQTVKRIKGNITSENITCEIKKVGWDTSAEVMRHLRSDFGIDISATLVSACADLIAREWNYNMLAEMKAGATAGNVNYGTSVPAGNVFDAEQWQKQIIQHLHKAKGLIYKARFADSVSIIGDSDSIDRIIWLSTQVGQYQGNGRGRIAEGVNIVGSLSSGEQLIKVGWWDTLAPNTLLIGARGNSWPQTGYVIAPYLGLYVTPQWTDPQTLDVMQSMMSEMAHKMVDGKYFATVTIQPGVAGTPV